ncbi:homeobox protein 5 [Bactrocera dorsalis]|uniref:Homeobox protein 5 n=1 Tax=Bactrocera dorsalis TaxID=27457 RepID=A0ABM3J2R1_BACDO|nr:homeobox protein 5 [Bactrocera dorsalis]XP_049303514.1 homeobox protein 5 [Bactrocera dorsalis]XP_049303515.1 homeobox protein 5 [Bactrocera dorsalis]
MIGTDEMSSTGMDISETFRAEELTKTDFFDFVSAPDMGIGIGVGADVVDIGMGVGSLHAGSVNTGTHQHHQQHQQQQHTHHQQHSHQQQQQQQQQQHAHHQQQQQQHSHEQSNNLAGSMPHDGGGGTSGGSACVGGRVGTPGNGSSCIDGSDGNSNGNSSDPTLQGYEFWHADKDPTSRLDATIFEDLDRYCWQQQAVVNAAASPVPTTAATHQHRATPANSLQHSSHLHSPASPNQTHPHQQQQHLHHQSPHQHMHTQQQQQQQQHQQSAAIHHTQRQMSLNNSSSCAQQSATQVANNNATNNNTSLSHNHSNNNNNNSNNTSNNNGNASMTVDNSDGQIYTITVLNGNESWLKREPEDAAAQLSNTLDLDSLLGSFPGYIKSEYPYDESPAGYGTAEGSGRDGNMTGDMVNGLGMGANAATGLHGGNSGSGVNSQRLPSLVTAISLAGGVGGMGGVGSPSQLAQFQNNNNDWHMADHNAEQNSAESLLRSALQGKGYSKGIHMQNGISLLPSSPTVKEEEMRRLLFPPDTDTLSFGDSALSAAQMFEDTHPSQLVGSQHPNGGVNSAGVSSLMVDDMFLSLESAFSDDFEKIKRIANEVQQFCSPTSSADYGASDVLMQISPAAGANVGAASVQQLQQQQQQQLLSPATTPTSMPQQQQLSPLPQAAMPALHMTGPQSVGQPAPRVLHAQQQHVAGGKASAVSSSSGTSSGSTTKVTKKYKRSTSSTQHHNNNNNNNPNITNHNSSTGNGGSAQSASGATANSANGPTSGGSSSSTSSNSPTHCNGQRKERSLHYCSICSKGFKDKYSVNVHIRTHTGEKPFTCSLCGKSFRQKAHLAKHYQTHMAQKHNGGLVKSSGGSGGGGGGSNSSKHQRAAAAAAAATAAAVAAAASAQSATGGMSIVPNSCAGSVVAAAVHQRQLNVATSLGMAAGVRAVAGGVVSTVSVGGPMNGPTLGAVNANVLPPANGLLANR